MKRTDKSLQDTFAPHNACFGCGPSNSKGLQIKSFVQEDGKVIAHWTPQPHHEAFPGVLNGGVIGAILDCHCNWTTAWHLMRQNNLSTPPCTVTAEYKIKLKKPTPTDQTLTIISSVSELMSERALITGKLFDKNEELCATCEGLFVAVKPGHPAYHRW